ncbi:WXG100 family type VII secretion target [Kitasatospora sp. NPDC004240]
MAGGTNFEGIDHAKLKAMVANTSPDKVLDRGGKLRAAGRLLEDLGKALNAHLGQIEWEGPAAESFKTWATNLNKSAVQIGEYSRSVGETMVQAGEVLSTVKTGVPEVPHSDIAAVDKHAKQPAAVKQVGGVAGFVFGFGGGEAAADTVANKINSDWVTDAEAKAAQKRVYVAHQEAIHQLEKLSQAYQAATTKLNSLQQPELPQPPGSGGRSDLEGVPDGSGGGGGVGSGGGSTRRPRGDTGTDTYVPPKRSGGGDSGGSVPSHPGTTMPGNPGSVPPPQHPTPSPMPGDPGSITPPPMGHPDNTPPGTNLNSLPPTPTTPNTTVPGADNFNRPPVVSGGGQGIPPGPTGPGGSGGYNIPHLPTTGGSFQPKSGTSNGNLPPRSTPAGGHVFGPDKGGQGGRGGTGATGIPGGGGMHGMGGHGGASGGSARGRGLTSTSGGVVGGRKGPAVGGEFTPGGSGLRNRAGTGAGAEGAGRGAQGGMMGGQGAAAAGKNERDRRKRADYLHEDEETWTSGTPQSNPGVIE